MNQTLDFQSKKIAYVEAGWHNDIVSQARESFSKKMAENNIKQIDVIQVPGSLEIPLQCQRLAKSNQYDIIVAAGLIVDGGIYRHDFVASTVIDAMMQVQLKFEVPILSVVLTPHHFHDGQTHHQFFHEHFKIKGEEAAHACMHVLKIMSL